jgi:double-stranded uracil-DNA glycosylase
MQASEHTPESGFPPVAGDNARLLILGSMPSRKSLTEQQYYAHPQNAFWPIIGELFAFSPALPYTGRLEQLRKNGIALWDVAEACVRPGSMDHAIDMTTVLPNDFNGFLKSHRQIRAIFFNGRKAEDMFRRLVLPQLEQAFSQIECHLLPSTSPANAAMSRAQKMQHWQIIRQALETD